MEDYFAKASKSEAYSKKFVILGDPVALMRGRYSKGKVYDSQKALKLIFGVNIRNQHDDDRFFVGPIRMDFKFYFTPSPSWSANKRKQMLANAWMLYKPDTSNLIKLVEDVCTGILYKDDCIICDGSFQKRWDEVGRTEFIVTEIK